MISDYVKIRDRLNMLSSSHDLSTPSERPIKRRRLLEQSNSELNIRNISPKLYSLNWVRELRSRLLPSLLSRTIRDKEWIYLQFFAIGWPVVKMKFTNSFIFKCEDAMDWKTVEILVQCVDVVPTGDSDRSQFILEHVLLHKI